MLATLSESVPPLPLEMCVVSTKMINQRPDVVQGFVNAMLDATRCARTAEGKKDYIGIARKLDPAGYTDQQYEQLYDFIWAQVEPLGNGSERRPIPEIYVSNMRSMVEEKTIDAIVPLEKLVDARFVDQYLGNNGWFDVRTDKGGNYLRDMLRR